MALVVSMTDTDDRNARYDSRLEATSNVTGVLLDFTGALLAIEGLLTTESLELLLAVLLGGF